MQIASIHSSWIIFHLLFLDDFLDKGIFLE